MSVPISLGMPEILDSTLPTFADESTYLWSRCWVAVGVDGMLSEPGQVLPATIGNHGVHVLRHKDGKLDAGYNAFQQGSCWNIPVQCGNGFKIECPYVSCGHSRDGGVLDPTDEAERRLVRQVIGDRPTRRALLSFAQIGPVMFVAMPGNRLGELKEQVVDITGELSFPHTRHQYSGYLRKEAHNNWRFISENIQNTAQDKFGADVHSHVYPPNLIVTRADNWMTVATVKPISTNRSEITLAKYGNGMQDAWVDIWGQIIEDAEHQNASTGPISEWAKTFFF